MAGWREGSGTQLSWSLKATEVWNKPLFLLFFPFFSILTLYNLFFIKIIKDSSRIYKEPITLGNGDAIILAK